MSRIVVRIILLHFLLYHLINARWSRSRSNIKPNEGFEDIFDEIHHHEGLEGDEDTDTKSCKKQFVEYEDTILRTKDSMNNGAVFLKAINLDDAVACRDQCCDTVENGRYCDLAVYQDSDLDEDSDLSRCFLFSCIDEDGVDNCKTASKQGYVVFRVKKKKEKVVDELLDVLANITTTSTQLITNKNVLDHSSDCKEDFTVKAGFVINAEESIANGALLLKGSGVATSLTTCQSECCELKLDVSNRYCDFVVFQENLITDSDDKQQRCFLFSCIDQNGKFLCPTNPSKDYSVSKRVKHKDVTEMIKNTSVAPTLHTTVPHILTTTRSRTTHKALTSATLSTISPTSAPHHSFKKTTKCSRLMWQCDNKDCIRVTNVCNGIPNCRDGSDEVGCDVLDDIKVTKPSTSPFVRKLTSAPAILTSVLTTSSDTESTTESSNVLLPESPYVDPHNSYGLVSGKTEPQKGAVLPLALGLSVTICVLLVVACRLQLLKRKTRKRGKPLSMEESDYLINGMYL